MSMVYFLIFAALIAAVAAWTDSRTGHIPNWLTLGALGLGLLGHLVAGASYGWRDALAQFGFAVGGMLACAAVPALMFQRGAIGGGDVKLFAALGALCQTVIGLEVETYAFVVAAVFALGGMAYRGTLAGTLGRSLALVTNPLRKAEKRREVPTEMMTWFRLGPAIFVGAAMTLLAHWNLP
jgi:prepilin peptidase CpaA